MPQPQLFDEAEAVKKKTPSLEKFKLSIAVIGILSPLLALATFIGLKPEKTKILEWEYVSKNSLLNQSLPATDKIRITYANRQVKQLTVISARLANKGRLPIEANDVKDDGYPSVAFPSTAKIIAAEIYNRIPTNVLATIQLATNSNAITIKHGLLNPSDAIDVQILIDGEPGEITSLPPVNYRILGIVKPSTRYLPDATAKVDSLQISLIGLWILVCIASVVYVAVARTKALVLVEYSLDMMSIDFSSISDSPAKIYKEEIAQSLYFNFPWPFDRIVRNYVRRLRPEGSCSEFIKLLRRELPTYVRSWGATFKVILSLLPIP